MEVENDVKQMSFEDKIEIRSRVLPIKEFELCKKIGKKVNEYKDNYRQNWESDLKENFPECSKVVKLILKNKEEKVPFIAYAARCKKNLPLLFLLVFKEDEAVNGPKVVFTTEYFFDLCEEGPFIKPKI